MNSYHVNYIFSGLKVTNVTIFVRFEREKAFKQFGEDCSNGRRAADQVNGDEIGGLIWKLLGNSFYGEYSLHDKNSINVLKVKNYIS